MDKENRLFVNLTTAPFLEFDEGSKKYEVRAYGKKFTEKTVYTGRTVELRNAWNRGSLWGSIGEVVVGNLESIFDSLDFKLVEPKAGNVESAINENKEILNNPDKYIVFEVRLER